MILYQLFDKGKDPYVVQISSSSGEIAQIMINNIHECNPSTTSTVIDISINGMIPWLVHYTKITIVIPNFQNKPKKGFLQNSDVDSSNWYFISGRSKIKDPIHLNNFYEKALLMSHNNKLFEGLLNK